MASTHLNQSGRGVEWAEVLAAADADTVGEISSEPLDRAGGPDRQIRLRPRRQVKNSRLIL